ncbi:MAG: putative lipid II flippase FtsW [Gammaproteobacteria bacterium]|nr:MAG: putative lipid II flippase FtsW [Gammaproteobacteria bacterium]
MQTSAYFDTTRHKKDTQKHVEEFRRTQSHYNSRWAGLVAPDAILMIAIGLLMVIGVVMVTSASIPKAGAGKSGWIYAYGFRQLAFMGLGLIAAFFAYRIPSKWWFDNSYRVLGIGLFMLIVVQIPGVSPSINGAKRWIPLGPVNFQVSEFVRICIIIYAAAFLQRFQNQIHKSLWAMVRLMIVLALVGLLLLLQPDFGSTAVIFAVVLGMMFLAGVCLIRFTAGIVVVGALGLLVLMLEPYRVARLQSYFNEDPLDKANMFSRGSFQLANSLIAIGRGEITGVGIGESMEKHAYLPEAHTDFIFSILAEETGLIGVCVLMTLFSIIVWRAFVIAINADKVRLRFSSCVAYGVGLWIGMQALINMAVASGLLPTKGLTLPLISYGGSSLVASLILLAILLRIDSESRYLLKQEEVSRNAIQHG